MSEKMTCNVCGETWVDQGTGECPFCGSDDIEPVEEEEEEQ